jgi:hypothetical protein
MSRFAISIWPSMIDAPSRQAAIGCCDDGADIDDEHLVASETLGQHLVGLGRAASGGRLAYGGEAQTAVRCSKRR